MLNVYGEHGVRSLLESKRMRDVHVEVDTDKKVRYKGLLQNFEAEGGRVSFISNLSKKYPKARHQGIVASFKFQWAELSEVSHHRLLMLDRIQDPHNFGACLRSAAAFGVTAVIVPKREHAPINEIVCQVSCGGALIVPIVQVGNLNQVVTELKDKGVWFVATDEHATQTMADVDRSLSLCLVMGSEGDGVKQRLKSLCDFKVSIPTEPRLTTLNVSVATGVLLYDLYKVGGK